MLLQAPIEPQSQQLGFKSTAEESEQRQYVVLKISGHGYFPSLTSVSLLGFLNLTFSLFSALKDNGFSIQERGQIEIKGKGQMTTYFLIGNLLVSEDSIMGREGGQTCLYREDLYDQSEKGK